MDFDSYFTEYKRLVAQVDGVFKRVLDQHGARVRCRLGCSDCCHALFDISVVEAIYIKQQFDQLFTGTKRSEILERANRADRAIHRLKKKAFKDHEAGKTEDEVIVEMAVQRVRCPLLDDRDQCMMYDVRPITCRLYGIPTEIGGRAHTCGLSGFVEGESYPTVKFEVINKRLFEISNALAQSIGSRYPKLAEMIVPLSMALLTEYSETYLGVPITDAKETDAE